MKDRRKPCKSVSDEDIAKKTECPMDKCIFADKCYEKELPGILYLSHLTCNVKGILDDEESYQDLKRGFDYKYTFARSIIEKMSWLWGHLLRMHVQENSLRNILNSTWAYFV